MGILEKLKTIIREIEAAEAPYKKEIAKNNDKLGKLQIKKNKLSEEINSNIRPAIKAVKKRELDEVVKEIGILQEDIKYLEDMMKTDDNITNLIDQLGGFRAELSSEKIRITKAEANIREEYRKVVDNKVKELWENEKDFNEAKEKFFEVAIKYEFGLAFSQV